MESGQHWVGEVRAGERYASVFYDGANQHLSSPPGGFLAVVRFGRRQSADAWHSDDTKIRQKERDITHSAYVSESYGSFMSTNEEEEGAGRGERSLPLENVTACAACP